eukprot:7512958-Pyramimonas_sp.AAC.1
MTRRLKRAAEGEGGAEETGGPGRDETRHTPVRNERREQERRGGDNDVAGGRRRRRRAAAGPRTRGATPILTASFCHLTLVELATGAQCVRWARATIESIPWPQRLKRADCFPSNMRAGHERITMQQM